jgi:transposase
MELYVGIDLHSNNSYIVILSDEDKVLYKKRQPNDLAVILYELKAYQDKIKGIVVESTYNWYWLVDGLEEAGYKLHLANTMETSKYSSAKYTDDSSDAKLLAELLKDGKLKEGYIYPKEMRGLREILRRRMRFVQQRTMILLGTQSLITRYTGRKLSGDKLKKLAEEEINILIQDDNLRTIIQGQIKLLHNFTEQIEIVEKSALKQIRPIASFKRLMTIPGVGEILAMVILLETGAIERFTSAGNYCSYCRCVKSERLSNGKKKGQNNRKNGNPYLSWAFMEAANYAIRYNDKIKKFYQRKMNRTHKIVALKTVAAKLSKASYFIMKEGVKFELEKTF